jgi:ketosteroid isomerase-like protein
MSASRPALALALALLAATPAVAAPAQPVRPGLTAPAPADLTSPAGTVAEFVAAVNALDQARLGRLFAEDATIFFPGPPFPLRRTAKADAMRFFGQLFQALRGRGAHGGNSAAQDLQIQPYGDVAVATFHLIVGQDVGRRTLVLRRIGAIWQIVHMHSSAMRRPAAAAPATPAPATPPPPRR